MGLDMYLTKRHSVGNRYRDEDKQVKVVVPENQEGVTFKTGNIKQERVEAITEMIHYWRKANAIHKWFVDNIQGGNDNCRDYYVDRKELEKLRDVCKEVLAHSKLKDGKVVHGYKFTNAGKVANLKDGKVIEDATKANELLPTTSGFFPTTSGFFYGGTDYDEFYYNDIKETLDMLEEELKEETDFLTTYQYTSSW